jgi:hypothetical protein
LSEVARRGSIGSLRQWSKSDMEPLGAAFITFLRIRDQRRPQRQLSERDCAAERRPIARSLLETSNESSSIQPCASSTTVKPGRKDDDEGPGRQWPLNWSGVARSYA